MSPEFNNVGKGWRPLLTQLFDDLGAAGWAGTVLQVKKKFGTLRVYVDPMTVQVAELILAAEDESRRICEVCGKPGETRKFPSGYRKTLCEADWREQHLRVTGVAL